MDAFRTVFGIGFVIFSGVAFCFFLVWIYFSELEVEDLRQEEVSAGLFLSWFVLLEPYHTVLSIEV